MKRFSIRLMEHIDASRLAEGILNRDHLSNRYVETETVEKAVGATSVAAATTAQCRDQSARCADLLTYGLVVSNVSPSTSSPFS